MLGRLFGKKPLNELESDARRLYEAAAWGEAKLAYDRLETRAAKEQPELARQAAERVIACCDNLADARVTEALDLAKHGHLDLAREELKHALETARSEAVTARVREAQRKIEQRDAVVQARRPAELSDEERLILITSTWEPLQAEELESYGEPLSQAVLAIELGDGERAMALLEPLLASAKEPSYLWLEVGRAKLARDDDEGAAEALRTFLSRIGPEEGGAARQGAHRELARIAHKRGDHEEALAELEACAAALENEPGPLHELGSYLRQLKRPQEAIEVLELCGALFVDGNVEWPVTMELGLACADIGESARAIQALEAVLEQLSQRGHTDFPPQAVVRLAKLHEEAGDLTRAADLYRALTEGSDGPNHGLYHRETARLLEAMGLSEEALRMRERAAGLDKQPQG
jgi:Tfp pilus assembly protein PilF